MELKEYLAVMLMLIGRNIPTTDAVQCYKCILAEFVYFENGTYLCKDFDYSDKFIIDCPYSTLCMKKNSFYNINGVHLNGTERDCASQKHETQKLEKGKWLTVTIIEEPYKEGCQEELGKGQRTANVEYCYCRGHLCNSGTSVRDNFYFMILNVLGVKVLHEIVTAIFL